jgi:hypothetical protein
MSDALTKLTAFFIVRKNAALYRAPSALPDSAFVTPKTENH